MIPRSNRGSSLLLVMVILIIFGWLMMADVAVLARLGGFLRQVEARQTGRLAQPDETARSAEPGQEKRVVPAGE